MIDRLIELTEGDLRRSINTLQTCASFARDRELTIADIESISGVVPRKIILKCHMMLSTKGISYSDVQNLCEELVLDGYDCQQLLLQLVEFYAMDPANDKLSNVAKGRISELVAATDFQLLQGGNEELNLINTMS